MRGQLTRTIDNLTRKFFIAETFQNHMAVVQEIAAQYWCQDKSLLIKPLNKIQVHKVRGGKISGFLPKYGNFPSVFFKVFFREKSFNFETDGMVAANKMHQIEGIRAPKIVRLLPEYKAFLLEKRTWSNTDSEIRRFLIHSDDYDWYKIGKWLRTFHDCRIDATQNGYFLNHIFKKMNTHLELLQEIFTSEEMGKFHAIIHSAKDYFDTQSCEWVLSHGDFLFGNIKFSKSMIDIIDFENCQMAPREFDAINFLTRLEYTGYFPHRPQNYQNIREQFLKGYGRILRLSGPVHDFFYLYVKLDAIESYHRRSRDLSYSGLNHIVFKHFELQGLRRLTKWLSTGNWMDHDNAPNCHSC